MRKATTLNCAAVKRNNTTIIVSGVCLPCMLVLATLLAANSVNLYLKMLHGSTYDSYRGSCSELISYVARVDAARCSRCCLGHIFACTAVIGLFVCT